MLKTVGARWLQMSNKDFLLQKFQAVVFCDPTLPEKARIMLMTCMIDNPELIFDIPEGLKEEVEARICEIGKLGPAGMTVETARGHQKMASAQGWEAGMGKNLTL